jgi:hypothetical protein
MIARLDTGEDYTCHGFLKVILQLTHTLTPPSPALGALFEINIRTLRKPCIPATSACVFLEKLI